MKVVIDATLAELAETLNLLKNGEKKNAVTEADDICGVIAGKLDQVTRAISSIGKDYGFGPQTYTVGPQSHCMEQPAMGFGSQRKTISEEGHAVGTYTRKCAEGTSILGGGHATGEWE